VANAVAFILVILQVAEPWTIRRAIQFGSKEANPIVQWLSLTQNRPSGEMRKPR